MDPYLESPTHWSDFHATFVPAIRDAINQRLPTHYLARLGEHVSVVAPISDIPKPKSFIPDVAVVQRGGFRAGGSSGTGATALLDVPEPTALENPEEFEDERIEPYIRIVRLPEQDLVTVIELLSPTNKYGEGRSEYLLKRREFRKQGVNRVELDLLRAGERMYDARNFPTGHYVAMVTRGPQPRITKAYPWTVQHPMPAIPIPLKDPDPDVLLPLSEPFTLSYQRGRYDELIDYASPPPAPPFADTLEQWVSAIRAGVSTRSDSKST